MGEGVISDDISRKAGSRGPTSAPGTEQLQGGPEAPAWVINMTEDGNEPRAAEHTPPQESSRRRRGNDAVTSSRRGKRVDAAADANAQATQNPQTNPSNQNQPNQTLNKHLSVNHSFTSHLI